MTNTTYLDLCRLCGADIIIDDEGCVYCQDTLCPACCVEQLDKAKDIVV